MIWINNRGNENHEKENKYKGDKDTEYKYCYYTEKEDTHVYIKQRKGDNLNKKHRKTYIYRV